jgi:hypothetical protein
MWKFMMPKKNAGLNPVARLIKSVMKPFIALASRPPMAFHIWGHK